MTDPAPPEEMTKLEIAAATMRANYAAFTGDHVVCWSRADPELKDLWMVCAVACIRSLQDPSEAMMDALSATDLMWSELDSRTVLSTMLEGVLTEHRRERGVLPGDRT